MSGDKSPRLPLSVRRDVLVFRTPPLEQGMEAVSYTHLRAHETVLDIVCRLLLEKKKHIQPQTVSLTMLVNSST